MSKGTNLVDYEFTGTLTAEDTKRYVPFAFDLPAGTEEIHIDFQFEPRQVGELSNTLALSLYAPDDVFRGFCHGPSNHKQLDIGVHEASDGFFAGALPPGVWTVEIETYMVLPGDPVDFRLQVQLRDNGARDAGGEPSVVSSAARNGTGWYRGDLHTHTRHSDGELSVSALLEMVRHAGFDFVALTDHNNTTQLADRAAQECSDLVIVPGMELTTYYGHALSLGVSDWFDWRVGRNGRQLRDVVNEVHARDALFVIAHPAAVGDPMCTGCKWLFGQFMPGGVDAVEVWNGPWASPDSRNEETLQLWYAWLNSGRRLPATAGTDVHDARAYEGHPCFNWVYASELSAHGLVEGIRSGHVLLSNGPRLWIGMPRPDGSIAMMGDAVTTTDHVAIFTLAWEGAPADGVLRLVADGDVRRTWSAEVEGARTVELMVHRWVVAEMRNVAGDVVAITNPIYLDKGLHL
ncbi:MAG: CehA/McbA family metallohydrolase [Chloroflexi bacterium]|nr:CehA/McbA family metallohydrolase [Chloroflexota bacterium]